VAQVYHGKRMQRIFCVAFSGDSRFVLSGSDDFNIRLWKVLSGCLCVESMRTRPMLARAHQRNHS
jgi:WD40 repeat protein